MEPVTFVTSEDVNIALVGGGEFTAEVLEKTLSGGTREDVQARIVAVADPRDDAPGKIKARELGCSTFRDYRALFQANHQIGLIIVLDPDPDLFEEIRLSKPSDIRILAHHTFKLFWDSLNYQNELLRQRTQEIETILNGIQDSILVLSPEMQVVEVNQAFLNHMGYTREEVISHKCYQILQDRNYKCDNGHMQCPAEEVFHTGQAIQRIVPRVTREGNLVYIEVSLHPITEADGSINRLVEISRDVTGLTKRDGEINKRLERMLQESTRELHKRNAQIQHQDKMASLGKLSAAVVHEINNPLSGILNLLLLMRRIVEEGPIEEETMQRFSRYISMMEKETRRISGITSNLLAFSRESGGEFASVDLNNTLEEVLFLNENMLRLSEVRLRKDYDGELPWVEGNSEQLKQLFMNLITNAVEAMEVCREKELYIRTERGEHTAHLLICDNGAGIPAHLQSEIFEPFFSTKRRGKGVGLGLSVAYGIVKAHCGSIDVSSQEGQGTRVTVTLPLKQPGPGYIH